MEFSEVGRLPQHCYSAYATARTTQTLCCLRGPAWLRPPANPALACPWDRQTRSPGHRSRARWISDGMPASFSTPSISSASVSSGAAATFTQLSAMHASYPRLFTEARRYRVLGYYSANCVLWSTYCSGSIHMLLGQMAYRRQMAYRLLFTSQVGLAYIEARSTEGRPP